jgi:hypothetical protein
MEKAMNGVAVAIKQFQEKKRCRVLLLIGAMLVVASLVGAAPAAAEGATAAGHDDTFGIGAGHCPDRGGSQEIINFKDYGKGAPGGGNNDDYIELLDGCGDRQGVKGWAWINGKLLGEKYNGKGYKKRVIWDPFGNVKAKDYVGIKVCIVDGNGDQSPGPCEHRSKYSQDG